MPHRERARTRKHLKRNKFLFSRFDQSNRKNKNLIHVKIFNRRVQHLLIRGDVSILSPLFRIASRKRKISFSRHALGPEVSLLLKNYYLPSIYSEFFLNIRFILSLLKYTIHIISSYYNNFISDRTKINSSLIF